MYGVQKGALSVSTAPFNALAASNSQHTYQILVPSLNVFVDRKIVWESGVYLQSQIWPTLPVDPADGAYSSSTPYIPSTTNPGAPPNFGGSASIDICLQAMPQSELYRRTLPANAYPSNSAAGSFPKSQGEYYEIAQPGTNFNLCPFPLQSLCNSMTCSINDCSVTTNGDTLQEQILLTNTRDTQRIRTTPSKFDQYAWTNDDVQSNNGNMSGFDVQRPAVGETPTGSWPITFFNPNNGSRLLDDVNGCGAYIDPISKAPVYYFNGRPVFIPGGILKGQYITVLGGSAGYITLPSPADGNGVGVARLGIPISAISTAQAFQPGCMFTITGLSGANAIWNGYYTANQVEFGQSGTVANQVGFAIITFTYGQVPFATAANNNAVQFVSRGSTGGVASGTLFYVTVDRFGNEAFPNNLQPVNYVSRLLGQIMPNGVQIMPSPANSPITCSMLYNVAEPVVMSPFIYQDALEFNGVGLYGCTNIQFTCNIQQPSPNCQSIQQGSWPTSYAPFSAVRTNCDYPQGGNVLRTTGCVGAFSNVTLTAPPGVSSTTGAFFNPRMVVQFLTPGPDVSLPLISNVPYMEFPRYTNTYLISDPRSTAPSIQSQTITLSSIPDFIMVYAKTRTRCQLQNETYIPIQRVAVTFDNFSNLCSNMTQYELYTCSVAAGLDMDYQTWRGYANACGRRLTNGACGSGVTSSVTSDFGNIYNVTVTNTTTFQVSYQTTTPNQPLPPSGPLTSIVIAGLTGAISALNGAWSIYDASVGAGGINSFFLFNAAGSGQLTLTNGSYNQTGVMSILGFAQDAVTGPFTTFMPVTSGAYSLGGSQVPYALSTGTADLWPATSNLYNVAGQNKFVPRATTQLTGGPLMLRMGQDVSLSPGLAPGTLGNFSIQLNLTLDNSQHFFDAFGSVQLTIIAVNSGYFETVRGQSAVRKTILNMADVESASVATGVTTGQLRRLVGGARGHTLSYMGHHMRGHHAPTESRKRQYSGSGL